MTFLLYRDVLHNRKTAYVPITIQHVSGFFELILNWGNLFGFQPMLFNELTKPKHICIT